MLFNARIGRLGGTRRGRRGLRRPGTRARSRSNALIVIDGIGTMELMSRRLHERVTKLLDAPNPVLATVPRRGSREVESVKQHPRATLIEVDRENRDTLVERIVWIVRGAGPSET